MPLECKSRNVRLTKQSRGTLARTRVRHQSSARTCAIPALLWCCILYKPLDIPVAAAIECGDGCAEARV